MPQPQVHGRTSQADKSVSRYLADHSQIVRSENLGHTHDTLGSTKSNGQSGVLQNKHRPVKRTSTIEDPRPKHNSQSSQLRKAPAFKSRDQEYLYSTHESSDGVRTYIVQYGDGSKFKYATGASDKIPEPGLQQNGFGSTRKIMDSNDNPVDTDEARASLRGRLKSTRDKLPVGTVIEIPNMPSQIFNYEGGFDIITPAPTTFGQLQSISSRTPRRFVVIHQGETQAVVLPILTYRFLGAADPSVIRSEHSIIFTRGTGPPGNQPFEDEIPGLSPNLDPDPLLPQAILVDPSRDQPSRRLDPRARLNYGAQEVIDYTVTPLVIFGHVAHESMVHLLYQYRFVMSARQRRLESSSYEQTRARPLLPTTQQSQASTSRPSLRPETSRDAGASTFQRQSSSSQRWTALGQQSSGEQPAPPQQQVDSTPHTGIRADMLELIRERISARWQENTQEAIRRHIAPPPELTSNSLAQFARNPEAFLQWDRAFRQQWESSS